MLALAVRTGADRHRQDLGSLMLEARPPILRPRPLGESAVASLVRASLGDDASAQLCRACAEATGGNPFLLSELLGEFRRDARPANAIDPTGGRPARAGAHRGRSAAACQPSRSARHPRWRDAVAVLGEQARLSLCARAGRSGRPRRPARWPPAWSTSRFSSPESRCVSSTRSCVRRSTRSVRRRAGRPARACRHDCWPISAPTPVRSRCTCWRPPPSGDRDVVTMLREAARSALVGGAPDTAAALLRRALDEPPDATDRPSVLFELGNAEHEIGDAAAPGHLREAGETATDPLIRARAFTALAWTTHPDARRQREQLPLLRVCGRGSRPARS